MNRNTKISIGLVAAAVAAFAVVALLSGRGDDGETVAADQERSIETTSDGPIDPNDERLVREDSPRLSEGTDAVFVEFLDFECEACGAIYPTIDELKSTYGDRVSFVVRYMPLHTSSMNAAKAAEAAGAQGRYVDMFDVLFQRQANWGHQNTPEEAKFFTYAEELGLDMDQFRADFDDPATEERIRQSEIDGRSLGVTGTPTMFMDGVLLEPKTLEELTAAFDDAIAN